MSIRAATVKRWTKVKMILKKNDTEDNDTEDDEEKDSDDDSDAFQD